MHSKKIAALLLTVLLLVSCGIDTQKYPRVEPMSAPVPEKRTLTLVVPKAEDAILEEALLIFQAKLEELSKQQLTLEIVPVENPVARLGDSDTELVILSQQDLQAVDNTLGYLSFPFLFGSAEDYLVHVGNPNGAVIGSKRLQNLLKGSIVGTYYGGATWLINRGIYRDELGFYSTLGANSKNPKNALWNVFGTETVVEGDEPQLFTAFEQEKIRYCEVTQSSQLPEATISKIKELVVTNHRFNAYFMVASKDADIPILTQSYIKEAFSYSVERQNRQRKDADVAAIAAMQQQYSFLVNEEHNFKEIYKLAKRYYKNNYEDLGISESTWDLLHSMMRAVP